jgi:hypothetical protein
VVAVEVVVQVVRLMVEQVAVVEAVAQVIQLESAGFRMDQELLTTVVLVVLQEPADLLATEVTVGIVLVTTVIQLEQVADSEQTVELVVNYPVPAQAKVAVVVDQEQVVAQAEITQPKYVHNLLIRVAVMDTEPKYNTVVVPEQDMDLLLHTEQLM